MDKPTKPNQSTAKLPVQHPPATLANVAGLILTAMVITTLAVYLVVDFALPTQPVGRLPVGMYGNDWMTPSGYDLIQDTRIAALQPATLTPLPSATPSPSASPTATPIPTNTPRPTATTIQRTTPTRTPPPTLVPFPTPTQEVANCWRVIAPRGLNVRSIPNVSGQIVSYAAFGEIVSISQERAGNSYRWGFVSAKNGWLVMSRSDWLQRASCQSAALQIIPTDYGGAGYDGDGHAVPMVTPRFVPSN